MGDVEDNNKSPDIAQVKAQQAVKYNEKFNIPEQTEKEEAETHENAEVEHLADERQL
jgi:hypothetical protein